MVNTVFAAFLGLWAAVLGTCHVLVIETFHLARHHRGDQLQIAQRCKGVGRNFIVFPTPLQRWAICS